MSVRRDLPVIAADGTRLLLDHYTPVPGDPLVGRVVVWIRTPYGRKGIASIAARFAKAGAHVVVEAVRGTDAPRRFAQPDNPILSPHLAQDGADIAAWLRAQPWFGGTIVTWGVSALGYACWALAGVDIPEWRLAILQDAQSELRDAVIYPGGTFAGKVMLGYVHDVAWQARHPGASLPRTMLASVRGARRVKKVLAELPLGTADQRLVGQRVDHFQELLAREHDDEYWKRFDLRRDAAGMPSLVHLASGWYDVCLSSVLADYRALREAGKRVRLVVGPWYHGRGVMDKAYRAEVDVWLRAAAMGVDPDAGPVRVHVGGVDEWRDLPDWPPPGYPPVAWHLQPDGALAQRPAPDSPPDRYRYDPAQPTPAVGGAMENFDGGAGAKDNRRLEQRADVLTYTSSPLEEDLEVIGPVTATIVLRSTLPNTDLLARVCDVHPDGRSVNLCDGVRRLRPLDPPANQDGSRTVAIDLIGIAHRFRTGHRLRLQISSGAHPRLVRNTGTGAPLATATELRPADQEIFHDPQHPSVLTLPTAPTATLELGS